MNTDTPANPKRYNFWHARAIRQGLPAAKAHAKALQLSGGLSQGGTKTADVTPPEEPQKTELPPIKPALTLTVPPAPPVAPVPPPAAQDGAPGTTTAEAPAKAPETTPAKADDEESV